MNRLACARAIAERLAADDIVICSLGSVNRSWRAIEARQPTYYCSDPMGLSLPIALGMALARPRQRVIALCGDGDLTLALSSLATVAGAGPTNLRVIVFNNARYETGGGQPLPFPGLDLAGVARACGIAGATQVADGTQLGPALDDLLAAPGPGLVSVSIDPDPLGYAPPPDVSQAEERARFMAMLPSVGEAS